MSFLSSLFSVFSGNSADTDRGNFLGAQGQLNNVFNYAFPTAKAGVAEGQGNVDTGLGELGDSASYYHNLLSGGREGALTAAAPTINVASAQADAQKKQLADLGTGRGGGVNAVGQEIDTNKHAAVDNAIQAARSGAAGGSAAVGGTTAQIGLNRISEALRTLGIGTSAAGTMGQQSLQSRGLSQQLHDAKAGAVGDIAGGLLDALFTGFGSSGSPAFPHMTPGQISGAYGGPTEVPLIN